MKPKAESKPATWAEALEAVRNLNATIARAEALLQLKPGNPLDLFKEMFGKDNPFAK